MSVVAQPPQNSSQSTSPGRPAPLGPVVSYSPPSEKLPLSERINFRLVAFLGVIALLVGAPIFIFVQQALTGGVIRRGDFLEVDLKAMSTFDFNQTDGKQSDVPQRWRELDGKKVLLIGEMWAPEDAGDGNLKKFQLVYSKTKCCFSGPPLVQHFVVCYVNPGAKAVFLDVPVKIYGTLQVKVKNEGGKVVNIYSVKVDNQEQA
jgi:hypothetical protein